jgi:hypothetical protein
MEEKKMEVSYIIDLDNIEKEKLSLSSLFEKPITIIIETNEDLLFSYVDKMYVWDDYIFILDKRTANRVFLFDKTGKFIRKIGNIGAGPGEYSSLSDFTIDEINREIYLLNSGVSIYKYKIDTGEFIHSINIENTDLGTEYIQYYKGRLFANIFNFDKELNYCLLREIDSRSGKQTNTFLSANEYYKGNNPPLHLPEVSPFKTTGNSSVKFVGSFMNVIMSIEGNTIKPFIAIKSKNFVSPGDLLGVEDSPQGFFQFAEKDKIYSIDSYLEFGNRILITISQGRFMWEFLYDTVTENGQMMSLFNDYIFSDIHDQVFYHFCFSDSKGLYATIDGDALFEFIDHLHSGDIVSDLDKKEDLLKQTEDSNPIVFYYESKK